MKLNLNISGYEGPLDLLLELSKKQKVDITKISLLELADQYLAFIDKNIENLKLSADYLVMASLLAFLKSKLLLPNDEVEEAEEIHEDLTQRLIHYDAIQRLSKKIFELPKEGTNFFNVNIKNEYIISNKIVPKVSLQDLILKYSEIFQKKKSISILAEENDLYNIEDGIQWLKEIMKFENKNWLSLFNLLPSNLISVKKKKSAIVSLLLASLSKVNNGEILLNQKNHYETIMVKAK
ncbi:MAG: segregation and condensation protein A [Alphaproteobacteria bacterium]